MEDGLRIIKEREEGFRHSGVVSQVQETYLNTVSSVAKRVSRKGEECPRQQEGELPPAGLPGASQLPGPS